MSWSKKTSKTFYLVDPLDRWIRLTVCAEIYHEPLESLRDFAQEQGITLRCNGKIVYINERAYQSALAGLPLHETKSRRDLRNSPQRPDPLPDPTGRRPRLRKGDADQGGSQGKRTG